MKFKELSFCSFLFNPMKKHILTYLILLLLANLCYGTQAGLSGYFEGEFIKDKRALTFPWNMGSPKQRLELKLNYSSWAYLSFAAETNTNQLQFLFNQGHIELKQENYSAIFFAREDRHWIDFPLLRLVDSERARDESWGTKAEGLRLDFYKLHGFSGLALISKYNVTEEGVLNVLRIGRDFGKSFYTGISYIKKDAEVYSLLSSLELGSAILTLEAARKNSGAYAYQIELRNLRYKGLWTVFRQYIYSKDFRVDVSKKFNSFYDHEFDRKGGGAELSYLFPHKAITAVYRTNYYTTGSGTSTSYRHPNSLENYYPFWSNYGELYVEFLGGISSKLGFEVTKDDQHIWKHSLFEIVKESQKFKVKLQYKIKDIGVTKSSPEYSLSVGERHLLGLELRVNLPADLQFYSRTVVGKGIARGWDSGFYQLAYRGFSNTEIYLEYGEPSHTEDNLVEDPDVADYIYRETENRIKLLVKFYF